MFRKEEKSGGILRAVLITVGAVVSVLTILLIIYKVFKKHFRITLECGDYELCDDDCFCEDEDFEPECCVYDGSCCGDCEEGITDSIEDAFGDAE